MKRIYISQKPKKQSPKDQAMEQLRTLRKKFEQEHPGLLKKVKAAIENAPDAARSYAPHSQEQTTKINRQKNLDTIAQLLGSHTASTSLKQKTKQMLIEMQEN